MSDWSFSSDDTLSEAEISGDDELLLSILGKSLKTALKSLATSVPVVPRDDFDISLPPIFELVAPLNDKLHDTGRVLSQKLRDEEERVKKEYSDLVAHKQRILLELNSTGSRVYSLTKDSDLLNDLVHQDQAGIPHRRYYFFPADVSIDHNSLQYDVLPVSISMGLLECITPNTPCQWLVPLANYVLARSDDPCHFDILSNALIDLLQRSSSQNDSEVEPTKKCVPDPALGASLTTLATALSFDRYMELISPDQSDDMPLILPRRVPNIKVSLARAQLAYIVCLATSGLSGKMVASFIRIACDFGARKHAFPRLAAFVQHVFPLLVRHCADFPATFVRELSQIRTSEHGEYRPLRQHDYELQFSVLELINVCVGPGQKVSSQLYTINCSFLAGHESYQQGTPPALFLKPVFRALTLSLATIESNVTLDFYSCYYKIRLLDYVLAQPFCVHTDDADEQKGHITAVTSLLGQLHAKAFAALKSIGLSASTMDPHLRQHLVQCLTDASNRLVRLHTLFHAVQVLAQDDIFYG